MASTLTQRLCGLLMVLLGAGLTAWSWYTALTEGYFNKVAAGLGPAFAVFGLGMILFPVDRREFLEKHGVDKPQEFRHLLPVWKAIFVAAVVAGAGNFFALWAQ